MNSLSVHPSGYYEFFSPTLVVTLDASEMEFHDPDSGRDGFLILVVRATVSELFADIRR